MDGEREVRDSATFDVHAMESQIPLVDAAGFTETFAWREFSFTAEGADAGVGFVLPLHVIAPARFDAAELPDEGGVETLAVDYAVAEEADEEAGLAGGDDHRGAPTRRFPASIGASSLQHRSFGMACLTCSRKRGSGSRLPGVGKSSGQRRGTGGRGRRRSLRRG